MVLARQTLSIINLGARLPQGEARFLRMKHQGFGVIAALRQRHAQARKRVVHDAVQVPPGLLVEHILWVVALAAAAHGVKAEMVVEQIHAERDLLTGDPPAVFKDKLPPATP